MVCEDDPRYYDRHRKCAVCDEFIGDYGYVYHSRLNYLVHTGHPLTDVRGHDISLDTVFVYRPKYKSDDIIQKRGEVD